MDGHKHEGLSDEALAREIEAALGVDPSPEFVPRIRARVADERVSSGWMWSASWRWAGAVAVVSAVAVIGLWTLRDPAPVPAPREVRIASPVETASPVIEPAHPAPVRAPVVRAVHTTPSLEVAPPFEVIISPDESAALQRLFTAINSRRIETRALPDLMSALKPPAPIEEIVLDPITISPLAALEGE
jgi:hypothetical protein